MNTNLNFDSFFGHNTYAKAIELSGKLTERVFHLKQLELKQREVNHWDSYGLIDLPRETNGEWRKFSFLDYIWLHLIKELRSMGVPLEIINKAKENVFDELSMEYVMQLFEDNIMEIEKSSDESYKQWVKIALVNYNTNKEAFPKSTGISFLLITISYMISSREPISLIVFQDGYSMHWDENRRKHYPSDLTERLLNETYISVPITNILKRFLTSEKSTFILPKLNILEENELQLLELISSGKYKTILVNFRDKKMNSLELVQEHDTKKKMVDVISEKSYQDILVKVHDGSVTVITNTTKIIFD
jgi:DNA-binding transcriptional MerR regulator